MYTQFKTFFTDAIHRKSNLTFSNILYTYSDTSAKE